MIKKQNEKIRNIAIIAHVDHGKTTLVDQMFRQSGLFRDNQRVDDRLMDRMDLERERGITIAAKNCAIKLGDTKINILDTPGHADFGGEVERALMMVDGALLLVDASEGPLPQTRFVLKKALERGLKIIVVINKIDRQDARITDVLEEIYDLFIDLDANDDQIDFPIAYAIGREGIAKIEMADESTNLKPLMDLILSEIPAPYYSVDKPFQMLVSDLDYNDYVGRLAIGRVVNGSTTKKDSLVCIGRNQEPRPLRISKLQVYDGLGIREVERVEPGDILILAGIEDVHIGDTVCHKDKPEALKRIAVDEPTVSMRFMINTSPFSGQEGKYVQSAKIKERLIKETLKNVALGVEDSPDGEAFIVKGRGELQLAILIETLRREGFELGVGRPQVIFREKDGKKMEPIEEVWIDCEEPFLGIVSEKLSKRKGIMISLVNHGTGRIRVQFNIPARGLIGYRSEFLTDTKGTGIMNAYLVGYEPYRGDFPSRVSGSLIADRTGVAVPYALFNLEPRGTMFILPGTRVYEGMIVGEHNRDGDLNVNACKEKKQSNIRSSGRDEAVTLTPVLPMTLEHAMEYIKDDELIEITPKNLRLRKAILIGHERKKVKKN